MLKRLFDIVCAVCMLLVFSPLLLLLAILIKLDSKGPIFYRGLRMGRYGHPFQIFKFRTMVPDAERLGGLSTAKDDARVTRIGKHLRKYKLDELPQLLNVIKGEMSMVGPRPEMPEYTRLYVGEEQLILTARPGITDYASLEFINLGELLGNEAPDKVYEEQVRPIKNALRVQYVREQTFGRDIAILVKTVLKLVGR
jgi:lipopolysaccharide/colanic/teichoic acid biosynthesis glycosyltransferase